MNRFIILSLAAAFSVNTVSAQSPPSYAKQVRPFLTKYCLECHNAKTQKGTLSLETFKAMMEGSDSGPVVVPGQPDKSKLVLLTERKDKPSMPPAKAKFQPTKEEVALLRAWVKAGAADDGANVKIELPAIKSRANALPAVTGVTCSTKGELRFTRGDRMFRVDLGRMPFEAKEVEFAPYTITALTPLSSVASLVAVSSQSKQHYLVAWHPHSQRVIVDTKHTDTIVDIAFRAQDKLVATASYDTQIHVIKSGQILHAIKEHSDAVYGLAFSPDGTMLASVSADRAMKIFDVDNGKLLYTLGEATDWLYAVAWSPDGKYLVTGGVDKSVRVYEVGNRSLTGLGSPKIRQSVFAHEGAVQRLVFTSDSKTLYSVGEDRVVKAWDIATMTERKVYAKQAETVLCLALREDAGQFVVGRYDGVVQVVDMKTGAVAHEFGAPKEGEKGRKGEGEKESATSPQGKQGPPPESPLLAPRASELTKSGDIPVPMVVDKPGASPAAGQRLKLNAYLWGKLDRAGAVHFFRFDVVKDQEVGVRVQTIELKSKIDPVLVFTDLSGKILAESNQGHLGHTFAKAGTYAVAVRDREFRGGADFTYRLWVGTYPVITSVFPMGLQRGTKGLVQVEGVYLPNRVFPYFIPANAKPGQVYSIEVRAEERVMGKAEIVAGEFPDVAYGAKIPIPGTANGRLLKENQSDVWSFTAKKGQRLIVEVNARRIGSRLDSIIEILDKNDQPVPRAVLRSQAKTNVTFRDHDSAQGNIRIEAWSELGVNDYLYVGNELMKIQALPTHPDADCTFFATAGQRIGYLDTTPTHHANGTPMYKVSTHPPGTTFPPNGFPVFTLYYKNDDGGPGFGRDSRILFDPPADGEYKVRIADARGMGGANFGYRLSVRHPVEQFKLKMSPQKPAVSKGSAVSLTFTAEHIDGFNGPIKISMSNLPEGFHMPVTVIEAGTYSTTVGLYAAADAKPPMAGAKAILNGEGLANGLPFGTVEAIDLPTLAEPGDIVTTTAESEVSLSPGGQTKMLVTIERRNGFKGRVPLEVRGLPHGVRVLDIGLNGILVNENETSRIVAIYAEPWVRPQDHPFVVLARREGKNTEHAAKSVTLKVK